MDFGLTGSDLRRMWFDLENGRPGDCTFLLDDGSTIEMHLYVMEFISPQLFSMATAMASVSRNSIFVRLRYIGRGNFLKLRQYIYAGMVAVMGCEMFSLLVDGMMLKVFDLGVMNRALQYFSTQSKFFLVYRNEFNESLVIPSTYFGETTQDWDIRYECLMAGMAFPTDHPNPGPPPSAAQANVQPQPEDDVITIESDSDVPNDSPITISDSDSEDVASSDEYDTRTMSTAVSDADEPVAVNTEVPELTSVSSDSATPNTGEHNAAPPSPILFDNLMRQYLEIRIQPPSSDDDSTLHSNESVITQKHTVCANSDADNQYDELTIDTATTAETGTPSPGSSDTSGEMQQEIVENNPNNQDTDAGTPDDDDDEFPKQHANHEIMYARRSLPLPFIQYEACLSDIAEDNLSNNGNDTDGDL
ncbi:uncharacterized protein LOC126558071 [Anopheles maculipalpis]|uniref:uncharacterized protein LOC126558071 n=1 Tax=Anopheles maculipalpis TaxID=1496333 RepID=UPI0021599D6D|nr:uncharacterized protein LOC126558071 [Anopheles maculipalpis]